MVLLFQCKYRCVKLNMLKLAPKTEQDSTPVLEVAREIDAFQNALFQLPEFLNLDTLTRFCRGYAQPTSEPTEFNLYSETAHFYIWLRLVTRHRDYNAYVHYYLKG